MSHPATGGGGLRRFLAPAVVLVALGAGAWAIGAQRSEIVDALHAVDAWSVLAAFLAGATGVYAIFRSWWSVVSDHGIVLGQRQALRIYGVGQAGKYLPGSVWSVLTQAEMVREYGGSRVRMGAASLVALLLSVVVALGLGALVLPFANVDAAGAYWFAPVIAAALGIALVPAVLNRAVRSVARLVRRPMHVVELSGGGIGRAAAWAVLGNVFFGLQLLALGSGSGLQGWHGFLLATAAYALAAGLGVLVVIAPAGAGVREVVIVVVLGIAVSTGAALTVALLSRVLLLVIDLLLAVTQVRAPAPERPRSTVFVSRRFPPSIGGMETLAAGVWRSMVATRPDSILLAHGGSNRQLAVWLPRVWVRLAGLLLRGRVDLVLVGDAPTFAVLRPLIRMARVRSAVMVLGLDVTYQNRLYRAVVPRALRRADVVIAISEATRDATVDSGVPGSRVAVLRLGVPVPTEEIDRSRASAKLRELIRARDGDVLLVTVGRLVRRKGVRWFIREVLPGLPDHVHYLVAGDGPDADEVRTAVRSSGLGDRVHLLGQVDDALREVLMSGADLFVQPNIAVPGDMEGFGLVTIEAAMRGTPVVAADLEGIKDAVIPDQTGILLASGDADLWIRTLEALVRDPGDLEVSGRRYAVAARAHYSEEAMGVALRRLLEQDLPAGDGEPGT